MQQQRRMIGRCPNMKCPEFGCGVRVSPNLAAAGFSGDLSS